MAVFSKMFTRQTISTWLFTGLFIFTAQAQAADAFSDYIADLQLLESQQARRPKDVIRYTDGEDGKLLRSVLDQKRVNAALETYLQAIKRGGRVTNFEKMLQPILFRYDEAFEKLPRTYEAEYLDSLDATADVAAKILSTAAMLAYSSPEQMPQSPEDDEAKDIQNMAVRLSNLAYKANAIMKERRSTEIRNRVANGMFTEKGAKRALLITERIAK